jgi:phosphoethanolamine N-methyltransferase
LKLNTLKKICFWIWPLNFYRRTIAETFFHNIDPKSILRYEKIFGHTYVSTGGEVTTSEFCAEMGLKAGMKVLDVGAGIGGSAFFMAKTFGVEVDGVDLSSNMVAIANDYLSTMPEEVREKVKFRVEDATAMDYPENHYDVVYSRDTILHIADKKSLFENFFKCLKPGGKVVITDYCQGDLSKLGKEEYNQDFKEYVAERGYHLLTVEQGPILRNSILAEKLFHKSIHIL